MKNYKNIVTLLTMLFIITLLFTACQNSEKIPISYSVLECGFSDSIPDANHKVESDFFETTSFKDSNALQNKIIKVNVSNLKNKEIKGTYQKSFIREGKEYQNFCSSEGIDFVIDKETGMLTNCFFGEKFLSKSNEELSIDECITIAKTTIEQFSSVNLSDDYVISVKTDSLNDTLYEITFTKTINEIPAYDCASGTLSKNGSIYVYYTWNFGSVPSDTEIDFIDISQIDQILKEKLDAIYQPVKDKGIYDRIEYGSPSLHITLDENKLPALSCDIGVDCFTDLGEGYTCQTGDLLRLLIKKDVK